MKANINIQLWDSTSLEECEKSGLGVKFMEDIFQVAFKEILDQIAVEGCEYTVDVTVEE